MIVHSSGSVLPYSILVIFQKGRIWKVVVIAYAYHMTVLLLVVLVPDILCVRLLSLLCSQCDTHYNQDCLPLYVCHGDHLQRISDSESSVPSWIDNIGYEPCSDTMHQT